MAEHNPTILVIEDETLLLEAISKKLKLSGVEVLSCTSGNQALDYLQNLQQVPAAIWLDYYLKDMDGLEFMKKLKANENWSQIPVIVVSNSASPEKVKSMLGLGAKKYILKAQYRLDEIIDMIKSIMNGEDSSTIEGETGD